MELKSLLFFRIHFLNMIVFSIFIACTLSAPVTATDSKPLVDSVLINELEKSVTTYLLNPWYPASVDHDDGGFYSTFDKNFKLGNKHNKMIVTQARHVWTNAKAAQLYPEIEHYKESAKHGYTFLRDRMWDHKNGGFHWMVDKSGNVIASGNDQKTAYGNSFAIYALAAYYHQSHNQEALDLAKTAFAWLEEHSHDPVDLGYFQYMTMEGMPIKRPNNENTNSTLGYKDQNSSIHLLEAFTELYQVWPDSLLRERTREMLYLIRDKMVRPKGYLTLFFQTDWTPVSYRDQGKDMVKKHHFIDHVSFGHDVEIAYLMLEADHVLGLGDEYTLEIAKKMVDHSITNGWDHKVGGFYDEGYYFNEDAPISIMMDTKNWWAQAEGMNSLLLMAKHFPEDKMNYYDKFIRQWNYIDKYLIDKAHGGWYDSGIDNDPHSKKRRKGHIWKGSYHNFRALANCIKMLQGSHE